MLLLDINNIFFSSYRECVFEPKFGQNQRPGRTKFGPKWFQQSLLHSLHSKTALQSLDTETRKLKLDVTRDEPTQMFRVRRRSRWRQHQQFDHYRFWSFFTGEKTDRSTTAVFFNSANRQRTGCESETSSIQSDLEQVEPRQKFRLRHLQPEICIARN